QSVVLTELRQTREFPSKVGQNSPWAGYLAAHPGADGDRLLFQLAGDVSVSIPGPHVLAIATKGASAGDALDLAKSVADAYVAEVNDTQRTRAQSSVGFYKLQVDQASTELGAVRRPPHFRFAEDHRSSREPEEEAYLRGGCRTLRWRDGQFVHPPVPRGW